MTTLVSINHARLLDRIDRLAAVNPLEDSSCCRLALTDADRDGRDLVVGWMKEAGLQVHLDQIGNIIGVRSGPAGAAPVMTGSHIDTVATGGRFDGAYGVIAGIEALQTLHESRVTTQRGLAVAVLPNEEGGRSH